MRANDFNSFVRNSSKRLAMPVAVYPALSLIGAKVSDIVTNPQVQFEAQAALHERYHTPFVLSAMDLSAEAEAFGCEIYCSDTEVPSVMGRLVTNMEQARNLAVPRAGDKRTSVYLETVRRLTGLTGSPMVVAGCIGPFSLAARLVGVSEAMEMTVSEPELMHLLLEKCTAFLTDYILAFRQAGARAVVMAEPAAGLLSPRSLSQLSSAYIKRIGEAVEDGHFGIVLHNCAARLLHLPAVLESGLSNFHFGAPMDIVAALGKAPAEVVLCGNLDPAAVFVQQNEAGISAQVAALCEKTAAYKNYVVSSGCDIPPNAPLSSLDAFYVAMPRGA
jgi:uroporphyrinogen decarboxylase